MSNYSTEAMALLKRAREEDEGVYVPPGRRDTLALAESLVIAGLLHKPFFGADEYTLTDAGRRVAWSDFQPAPVRLSVEECVYWLAVVASTAEMWANRRDARDAMWAAAKGEASDLIWPARLARERAFALRNIERARIECLTVRWLCRQALESIGRERPPEGSGERGR